MRESPWFVVFKQRPTARMRLFCFHYAGGNSAVFSNWLPLLPETVELIAIELPGRRRRFSEPSMRTSQEVVESVYTAMAKFLDKPYILFGYSIGAILAYELTRLFELMGSPLPLELIVAAANAPHRPWTKSQISNLADDDFAKSLSEYKGTPAAILENKELMTLLLPVMRADFAIGETYERIPRQPLTCPVTAFGGSSDTSVSEAGVSDWKESTSGQFSYHIFEGGHFFLETRRQELLERVKQVISNRMKKT